MIVNREITLRTGERFSFRTDPVDPYDAFRGKYLRVSIQGAGPFTNKVEYKRGQRLYAQLSVDSNGVAAMSDIAREPPEKGSFIKTECSNCREDRVKTGVVETNLMYYCKTENNKYWRWRSSEDVAKHGLTYTKVRTNKVDKFKYTGKYVTFVKVPFDRYYMDEKLAPEADLAYRKNPRRDKQNTLLNVRVRNGYALIESLEINGTPIRKMEKDEK